MNITLRQIQCFLQVATLGSFTRAAEKMRTMQPALSQQVRDLENELGIRLFDRTTRRVELTEGGAEFRNIAAKVLDDLESAEWIRVRPRRSYAIDSMTREANPLNEEGTDDGQEEESQEPG